MSRSNPNENTPNPATRWFEWKSAEQCFAYYDKDEKKNILCPLPFSFIVLDRTACVRGYNKRLGTGLYSNEVKSTKDHPLVVKYFSGGVVAQGLWSDIKDKVTSKQCCGKFALNVYIAFRDAADGGKIKLGAIQMTGCCLGAWFEFEKENRKAIYEQAVTVKTTRHDTSGSVEFYAPEFSLLPVSEETNKEAVFCDVQLQEYFKAYFARSLAGVQTPAPANHAEAPQPDAPEPGEELEPGEPPADKGPGNDDDIPF